MIRWNAGTPNISPLETIMEYCRINLLSMLGGTLLAIVVLILAINGEFELLQLMNLKAVLSGTSVFFVGYGSQAFLKQFTGRPPQLSTEGNRIETKKL